MIIKDTGLNLTPLKNFYRGNRTRAEEQENAGAAAGVSFPATLLRAERGPAAGRTDKIEISSRSKRPGKTGSAQEDIRGILREISADADPARIKNLKSRIDSGEYSVDSAELARILADV